MNIAFVQEEMYSYMSFMYLGAICKKMNHNVEVFIVNEDDNSIEPIVEYKPDIICFSVTTPNYAYSKILATKLKNVIPDSFILIGGWHPTFNPDILEHEVCFDALCLGEGEIPFQKFLACYPDRERMKKLPNIIIRIDDIIYRNPIIDLNRNLDELLFPARSIYCEKYEFLKNELTKGILVGRGCPFPCAYCFNDGMKKIYSNKGKYVRFRSPKNIVEEIKLVKSKYPMKYVQFIDDTFNSNRKWLLEFLDYYKKELSMPFLANCRIERLDENVIRRMKDAGVDKINFSIEHGNEDFRRNVLKRHVKNSDIIEGSRLIKKYNIRFSTSNMVGLPGETLEMAFETLKLNREINPTYADMFIFQPYPGTQLYYTAIEQGYLDKDVKAEEITGHYTWGTKKTKSSSVIKNKDINQMKNLQSFFGFLIKHPNFLPLFVQLLKLPHNRYFQIFQEWYNFKVKFKYSASFSERAYYVLQLASNVLPAFLRRFLEISFSLKR